MTVGVVRGERAQPVDVPLAPRLPWGGPKPSGQGRELGWPGIEANTELTTVTVVL